MYAELFDQASHELYEKGFLNFTNMDQGKRWWKDHSMMKHHSKEVLLCQAILRVIIAKREIKTCSWLELTLREYFKEKHCGDIKRFKMFMAERKRIRKLADELGASITEYLEKFNSLTPEKFKKWKEGKLLRMREVSSGEERSDELRRHVYWISTYIAESRIRHRF